MKNYITIDDVQCLTCESKWDLHRSYALAYNLDVFIETGTNEGGSTKAALSWARRVLTVEASREYFDKYGAQFEGDPRVLRAWADSTHWLIGVAETGPGRALIWLDTHNQETMSTVAELLALVMYRQNIGACVILIDDARWPGQPSHAEVATALPSHVVTLEDDIIRAVPR